MSEPAQKEIPEIVELDIVTDEPIEDIAKNRGIELAQVAPGDVDPVDLEASEETEIHVMRVGPLFDLDGGAEVFDLTEEAARELAETTQAIIEAGHVVPISFEHGIEAGHRGEPGADRRPYGEILSVFYDEERKGIYAKKQWTRVGQEMLSAAVVEGKQTAFRISPRVRFSPAHHPTTGEELGSMFMDVISVTSMPRQSSMEPVLLSREGEQDIETIEEIEMGNETPAETTGRDNLGQKEESLEMANQKKPAEEVVLVLGRGQDETKRIFAALELNEDAPAEELARTVEGLKEEFGKVQIELNRFKEEEAARVRAEREASTDEELNRYEFPSDNERAFFKTALLSEDKGQVELARKALESRTEPDQDAAIDAAIISAKERGALVADYVVTDEIRELSRSNPEIAVQFFDNLPSGQVVRTGEPAGSGVAGLNEVESTTDREQAGAELSRIARSLFEDGQVQNLREGHKKAQEDRPELALIAYKKDGE